jgi:hypothetical protein
VLQWPTFADAARQCGRARVLAGVHVESGTNFVSVVRLSQTLISLADSTGGFALGKKIGQTVFEKMGCAFRGLSCCAPQLV